MQVFTFILTKEARPVNPLGYLITVLQNFFIFLKKTLAFPKYYAIIMLIKKKGHRCAG